VIGGREAIVSGPRHLAERPRGTNPESAPARKRAMRAELDFSTNSQAASIASMRLRRSAFGL
jgi:hypothetical protein